MPWQCSLRTRLRLGADFPDPIIHCAPDEAASPSKLLGISRYNLSMQHSLEQIRQLAHDLPEDQRLQLANSLLESVSDQDEATEAQLAAEWDEEIVRRVAEIKAGTAATCSLDDLTSDLRSILDR
jgi:putative addiction module component (TIGR02574 family)